MIRRELLEAIEKIKPVVQYTYMPATKGEINKAAKDYDFIHKDKSIRISYLMSEIDKLEGRDISYNRFAKSKLIRHKKELEKLKANKVNFVSNHVLKQRLNER